jgi:hypothetical protein
MEFRYNQYDDKIHKLDVKKNAWSKLVKTLKMRMTLSPVALRFSRLNRTRWANWPISQETAMPSKVAAIVSCAVVNAILRFLD